MHNIYNINRSVAGHYIDFNSTSLNIQKGDSSFTLTRATGAFTVHIDSIGSEVTGNTLACTIKGWAYSNKSTSPAKSIYVSYNGKIIAKAKATRRIDVRSEQELTFDHCGFELSFSIPKTSQPTHVMTLIMANHSVGETHHLRIVNDQQARSLKDSSSKLDSTVTRPLQPSFEYGIESAKLVDRSLQISGWCYLKENPDIDVCVNFIKSGVFLGETIFQTKFRPDIGQKLDLENGHSLFGFEFNSFDLKQLPLAPQDRSIDMLISCEPNKKELIRIYSE